MRLLLQNNFFAKSEQNGLPNKPRKGSAIEPCSNHKELRKDNSPEAVNKQENVLPEEVKSPVKMAAAAGDARVAR